MKNQIITALVLAVLCMPMNNFCPVARQIPNILNSQDLNVQLAKAVVASNYAECSVKQRNDIEALLQKGVDVNALDSQGTPIFHIAVQKGSPEVVDVLLKNSKININSVNQNGESALWMAVSSFEMIYLLLDNGIDLNIKNKAGKTFMEVLTDRIVENRNKIKQQEEGKAMIKVADNKMLKATVAHDEAMKKFIEVWESFKEKKQAKK